MRFSASALVLFSIAALSGCNTPAGVRSFGGAQMFSPSEALVFPPPGGPEIVTVIGRTYSNAAEQKIILRSSATTPGQNYIKAEFFGPQKSEDTGGDALRFAGFRTSSLSREIRSEFPGLNIAMTASYLQNSYGAFSYAAGSGRGTDVCLYGWQDIRSPENMRQDFRNLGRIKVRLRLCEPNASVEHLLSVMYNYTITGAYASPGWNPYGTPQRVNEGLGRPGNPVYPLKTNDVPMRPGGEVTATVPPVRRTVAVSAPPRAEVQQPLPPVSQVSIPAPTIAGPQGQPSGMVPERSRPSGSQQPSQQMFIPSPSCPPGSGGSGCGQP
ncbi:cellulose biosynthesis protein BcsN [Agrobacterium tumefaciens]|uniref:cellulose biosynthesis protein BcsN n=1 Tax=Agrobacterium tumefaciens TaxID=358 RepID=UPI003BB99D5F